MPSWFARRPPRSSAQVNWFVLGIAAAIFIAIVVFESAAPANVVAAYGFVLPILLVAIARNRWLMVLTVALCIAVTYSGLLRPHKPGRFVAAVINRTVVAGVLVGVAYFAMTREERKAREEEARADLLRANAALVEVKDALNRSERLAALGLLASSVAHEVGTPLHSIAWQVQSLAEDPHVTPEMRKTIDVIDAELNRVVRIIKDKLSLTRQPKRAYARLRLDELAQSVVTLMKPSYIGKAVMLKADLGTEASPVWGDLEYLRQVLVNLLTNALAATKAGDEVVIVIGRRAATLTELEERRRVGHALAETMVTLTVRDTGSGMPEDTVAKAFEPFFTTKSVGEGTGLGLYLSREIVASHGGSLTIDSAVGKGTMVVIALPNQLHLMADGIAGA
ncbi:MAG: HAMP domain-containing histidine kinase [Nitrospirota bacterium]|nr:HAMP domain-containing histidine kinase [Nitrospirota bacterium]